MIACEMQKGKGAKYMENFCLKSCNMFEKLESYLKDIIPDSINVAKMKIYRVS